MAAWSFNRARNYQPMGNKARDWSWKLHPVWMVFVLCFDLGLLATIVVLTILSSKNNGIATVRYASITSLADLSWTNLEHTQFRWTTLPTWVFSLFSITYGTIVSTTAGRQPFVELNREQNKAKNAKLTILLDYPDIPIFYNWFIAFRNCHVHLGFGMLFEFLASLALVPLASSMFKTSASQRTSLVVLNYPGAFNVSLLTARTDLQPSIDVSSAIQGHGAAPPQWMTEQYGLEAFSSLPNKNIGNVTVDTFVYSVDPQCRKIDQAELDVNFTVSNTPDAGQLLFGYSDRNCSVINQGTTLSNYTGIAAITMFQICNSFSDDRIGTFSGIVDFSNPDGLDNLTVISCQPSYKNSSASVTVALGSDQAANVLSVIINNTQPIGDLPEWRALHSSLFRYTTFDPSNTFISDAFGKAVYNTAKRLSPAAELDPDAMLNATASLYTTLFANLASTQMIQPLNAPRTANATLSVPVTRLYVVVPVACAMAGLLSCMLMSSLWLLIYSLWTKNIKGQPVGLLGRAAVLYHSNVTDWVEGFFATHHGQGKVVDFVKENYNVKDSRCWFGKNPTTGEEGIVLENLDEKGTGQYKTKQDLSVQRSRSAEKVSRSGVEVSENGHRQSGERSPEDGDAPERAELLTERKSCERDASVAEDPLAQSSSMERGELSEEQGPSEEEAPDNESLPQDSGSVERDHAGESDRQETENEHLNPEP